MKQSARELVLRAALGGAAGLLLAVLLYHYLFGDGHNLESLCWPLIHRLGLERAVAVTFLLFAALGAAVGVATLPFAESGRALVLRSLLHFAVTAALWLTLAGVCFGVSPSSLPAWLAILAMLYLLIWLGRWIGWYVEVARIRVRLGLAPGPSPLKWRETLPYLPFLLLVCVLLPLALRWLDRFFVADVPVFSGLVFPFLLLPVSCLCSGVSLGKRQGLCLLYPVLAFLLCLTTVLLLYNSSALFFCAIAFTAALAGNLVGTAYARLKRKCS